MYVALSGGPLLIKCDVTKLHYCLMELYTQQFYFSWKYIFLLLLYLGMLGRRWMCMHLWMNLIKMNIYIPETLNKNWKSMYKLDEELSSCDITFWQSSIQGGRHTQLCIITSLKWIKSKSAQTFTDGFLKLHSTRPIHIVWGNFPFNSYVYFLSFTLLLDLFFSLYLFLQLE